ncbi:MAG: DNA polymerase III subunit delta [Planctomycetaceae bacterium]
MHATEFLKSPHDVPLPAVVVIHGAEAWLKHEALRAVCQRLTAEAGEDAMISSFSGDDVELKTVVDELRTVSMWGEGRIVAVEDADRFVTDFRAGLESYVAAPAKQSTLILLVKMWRKNTRLAKAVAKSGLNLECVELKGSALLGFVSETARREHGKRLTRPAAGVLVELAGSEPGQLSQQVAKLASYVGERNSISEGDIRAVVGGWSTQTAFAMIDALVSGRLEKALELLDRLLSAGEAPQRILGAISFSFRRIATGTENARQGMNLRKALAEAGVFRNHVDDSNNYLRRIGRPRAEKILRDLLTVDANLKGDSRATDRLELEQLLVRLSGRLPVEMS